MRSRPKCLCRIQECLNPAKFSMGQSGRDFKKKVRWPEAQFVAGFSGGDAEGGLCITVRPLWGCLQAC